MTVWEWVRDFERRAAEAGDGERLALAAVHAEAYEHRQADPDRMLAVLEDGRRRAAALREPWWVLFFEHWITETYIYYKDDYRGVIDRAVRLALELRKPAFERCPLRFGVWCNLVAAYLCVDPRGHAGAIREALAYLGTLVPADGGDRYLLQARRHWFAYEIGELEEAHRLALEELAMCDADPDRHTACHHEVDTLKALCWVAFRRGDRAGLGEFAGLGEARAREIGYAHERAQFLLWLALCARRDGRPGEAARLYRQGTSQMARLGQPAGEAYYDALAAYHELGADPAAAWEVRQRELAAALGKGQLAYEAQVRVKRTRLLRRLGRPADEEERLAREAIAKLRDPSWYLAELGRVAEPEA